MLVLEKQPLTISVPLREEPAGVLRIGGTRVLLELVLRAHQRGASAQEIVSMYPDLDLGDVYAVLAYYLGHAGELNEYLSVCDQQSDAARRQIEAERPSGPTKAELLARAQTKGLNP